MSLDSLDGQTEESIPDPLRWQDLYKVLERNGPLSGVDFVPGDSVRLSTFSNCHV